MADVNHVWNSAIVACRCDAAALADPRNPCANGAYAWPDTPGYVFYDQATLDAALATSGGLPSAAAWVIAHEAGHNVQFATGLSRVSATPVGMELSADCLAGYWIAVMSCEGRGNMADFMAAMTTACSHQDPGGSPWFYPGTHGGCAQREAAVLTGIQAQQSGTDPLTACNPGIFF